MANLCSIEIIIPLEKVPDTKEREQLTALFEAEKKWNEGALINEELRTGKNRDSFLSSQPGVPNKRTEWKYNFFDAKVKSGLVKDGDLKPDSEQWNMPTIHAYFQERDGKIWVHPYDFGRGEGLLFDNENGITFERPEGYRYSPHLAMRWEFKWSFPWWAEVGFAGGQYRDWETPLLS